MSAGLRALLTGVIDYAGLFPPAGLPLNQAIRNYARYRTEPESWMLGRFIIPAARLNELDPFMDQLFAQGPPLAISALGRGGNDETSFLNGLKQDLAEVAAFRKRHFNRAAIGVFETRIPIADELKVVDAASELIRLHGPPNIASFFEVLPDVFHPFSGCVANGYGLKLRCGGLDATAFPSTMAIAEFLVGSQTFGTPLKFTAGLHHPIRQYDSGVKTHMHGFLNVFVAGVFAYVRCLHPYVTNSTAKELCRTLEDEDATHFAFDGDGLRWCDHRASVAEIEAARRARVISFGSCSFDEPRNDLRQLGLLEVTQ